MFKVLEFDRLSVPKEQFDFFVQNAQNGTIFSESQFYAYHDVPKNVRFFVIQEKQEWLAVCVGAQQNQQFKSPFAASYGGIILKKQLRFEKQEQILNTFIQYLKEKGVLEIVFVHPPLCYAHSVDQSLDFLMKYSGFNEDQTLISSVVDLDSYSIENTSYKGHQQIEKAIQLGVEVRALSSEKEWELFYEILVENKAKFNLKPTHSFQEINRLRMLFPERMMGYGAFYKSQLVAGAFNFVATSKTVLAFYIATDYAFSHLSPTNALIHYFIEDAKKQGFKWLDLGVSMETDTTNPMDPRRSLIFFKEHFGSRGQTRSRFVLKIS